jgi:hypothetical protein
MIPLVQGAPKKLGAPCFYCAHRAAITIPSFLKVTKIVMSCAEKRR